MTANGWWAMDVTRGGKYEFELRRWPDHVDEWIEATAARLRIADVDVSQPIPPAATKTTFPASSLTRSSALAPLRWLLTGWDWTARA